jgi:hypothetical protein
MSAFFAMTKEHPFLRKDRKRSVQKGIVFYEKNNSSAKGESSFFKGLYEGKM